MDDFRIRRSLAAASALIWMSSLAFAASSLAPNSAKGLDVEKKRQLQPNTCTVGSYSAGIGLVLSDTTFSVAPTYRLPQSCTADQIAQWKGSEWACGTLDGNKMPAGTVNQTLRYDASNAPAANSLLLAEDDGGLVVGGTFATGNIPTVGAGTRLMWYPAKAAFRAGIVNAGQWDDANVGEYSTAVGINTVASGGESVAMGGFAVASGANSLATGYNTKAIGGGSTALGNNTWATAPDSTAMGYNTTAAGEAATAMGFQTVADGASSTAMGRNVSTAGNAGSFIYGDASTTRSQVTNTAPNQFVVAATGGVYFFTGCGKTCTTGVGLASGSGSWFSLSDRNAKTAVQPVDGREVLKKIAALPLNTWQYKTQETKYRHMGPMAQDFYAAFHLGESDKGIDTVDADGVALAAIQGLNVLLTEKDARIAALESQMSAQRQELAEQKGRIAALSSLANELADMKAELASLRRSSPSVTTVALTQP